MTKPKNKHVIKHPFTNRPIVNAETRCTKCMYYGWPSSIVAAEVLTPEELLTHGVCTARAVEGEQERTNGTRIPYGNMRGVRIDVTHLAHCALRGWYKESWSGEDNDALIHALYCEQLGIDPIFKEHSNKQPKQLVRKSTQNASTGASQGVIGTPQDWLPS